MSKILSEEERIELNKHVDFLSETRHNLDLSKITVLTGNNGSGKSVIRKLLYGRKELSEKGSIKALSMDIRTGNNPELGAFSSFANDLSWLATSHNSLYLIRNFIKGAKEYKETKFLILDEFEIGCSEETILALVNYFNEEFKDRNFGCLIITHSRIVVKELIHDKFINLQHLTESEWLERKVIPTNLESIEDNRLSDIILERSKK